MLRRQPNIDHALQEQVFELGSQPEVVGEMLEDQIDFHLLQTTDAIHEHQIDRRVHHYANFLIRALALHSFQNPDASTRDVFLSGDISWIDSALKKINGFINQDPTNRMVLRGLPIYGPTAKERRSVARIASASVHPAGTYTDVELATGIATGVISLHPKFFS